MTRKKAESHVHIRTKEWLRKADHRISYLRHTPFNEEDPPTDLTCVDSAMVAEYCLKAFLCFNRKKLTKSHDLDELHRLCEIIDPSFNEIFDQIDILTGYKSTLTYPGNIPVTISVEEAENAIKAAQTIRDFIGRIIKFNGGPIAS